MPHGIVEIKSNGTQTQKLSYPTNHIASDEAAPINADTMMICLYENRFISGVTAIIAPNIPIALATDIIVETEEMFEAFNKDKSTYIRCNTKKTDIAGLTAALEAEGVTVTNEGIDKRIDYALKISGYDYLGGLKSFRDGLFFVQDISSMLASQGGFIKRDAYVIDVCAAPGGKSINAALMADIGHVSSRDISGRKVSLIKENAERLGIDNITYKVWDAVKKDEESVEKADVLICDLPCSGLGIIGRKPDIKYNVTYEKIKELALLQRKILSTVWEYVKKDGILIYSTCTVTPEENAENTEWLVNNYPFELIGKPEQIMPQDGTGDGFYIARLKRTE